MEIWMRRKISQIPITPGKANTYTWIIEKLSLKSLFSSASCNYASISHKGIGTARKCCNFLYLTKWRKCPSKNHFINIQKCGKPDP